MWVDTHRKTRIQFTVLVHVVDQASGYGHWARPVPRRGLVVHQGVQQCKAWPHLGIHGEQSYVEKIDTQKVGLVPLQRL